MIGMYYNTAGNEDCMLLLETMTQDSGGIIV